MCLSTLLGCMVEIATIVGPIMVIVTLAVEGHRERRIQTCQHISAYNYNFISSEPLIKVERDLESCYQENRRIVSIYRYMKIHYKKFKEDGQITKSYHRLVNYLVYLESIAPLIINNSIKLRECSDLFAYRYFIAMHNPYMIKHELKPGADYYNGCIQIYKKWITYCYSHSYDIPLKSYAWYDLDRFFAVDSRAKTRNHKFSLRRYFAIRQVLAGKTDPFKNMHNVGRW